MNDLVKEADTQRENLKYLLQGMSIENKQDMISIFSEMVHHPGRDPFAFSSRNPDYYVPRIERIIHLLAVYRRQRSSFPNL